MYIPNIQTKHPSRLTTKHPNLVITKMFFCVYIHSTVHSIVQILYTMIVNALYKHPSLIVIINHKITWCNYTSLGIFYKVHLSLNVVSDNMDNLEIKKNMTHKIIKIYLAFLSIFINHFIDVQQKLFHLIIC